MTNLCVNSLIMKNLFLLSLLGSFLLSCGETIQNQPNDLVKVQTASIPLSASTMFDGSVVKMHVDASQTDLDHANQLFLEGIDLYRNQNKLEEGLEKMKESVMRSPSPKAYYEIGNVNMDLQKNDDALKAYNMAEELGYEPFSKVLYNIACVYSLTEKADLSGKYLEYAIQAGYTNLEHIQKDTDLENLRKTHYFNNHLDRGIAGMSNAKNLYWLKFKNNFPLIQFPAILNQNLHSSLFKSNNFITYDYERYIAEMRDEKFSREVSRGFYYYARLPEQPNYTGLIYVERDEFLGDYAPVTYKLATFNTDGKLIDKRVIAGCTELNGPLKVCEISTDGELNIKFYKTTYEKDPDEHGFYENKIVDMELVNSENWSISNEGKIILSNSELLSQSNDTLNNSPANEDLSHY